MRTRPSVRLLPAILLLWFGWACSDTLVDLVDVASVQIAPASPSLTPGQSLQLQATLKDDEGNTLSGRTIQWSSDNTGIATISASGLLLGVAQGTTTIRAAADDAQGSTQVTVAAAPVIIVAPDSVSLSAIIAETETAAAAVALTNGGGGTLAGLSASISYDGGATGWLESGLSGAAAPATLSLTADAAGLTRGRYRASVTLTSTSPGVAAAVVRVVFDVLQRSPAPTLISATPDRSAREQSLDVIMTGSGFIAGLTTVGFGSGITINDVTVEGPTTLTAAITVGAAAAVGARDVSVSNPAPGGGTAVLTGGFIVEGLNPRPAVTRIEPATAQRQATLDVMLEGTGFLDEITIAGFGPGIAVNAIDVTSATTLTANITVSASAATGARDITVANPEPGGGVGTLRDAFTVVAANPAPTLTSIAPASAQRLDTVAVQLTGTNFAPGLTTVSFGQGIVVSGTTVTSPTTINASIAISETAALGVRPVSVTNAGPGGGTATLATGFTVLDAHPAPAIAAIDPASGRVGQTFDVAITGSGFVAGTTTFTFGAGTAVNSVIVTDATEATASITVAAEAALGVRDVTVQNPAPGGGSMTLTGAFTVTGFVSADLSTVTAAPSSDVAADGTAVSTVTVIVRDAASGPVRGLAPDAFVISVTGSAVAGAIAETATPGTYAFTVSNTVAEAVTVNVAVEGVTLDAAPTIGFVATAVSAANSSVSATPIAGIIADGAAVSLVTVLLRDPNDNPVGGLAATAFAITLTGTATAGTISETATAGTYTFTVTNTVAEDVTVSVSAGGSALNEHPVIAFVPGTGSATATTASVPNGTAGAITSIAITVRDANDNPVTGAAASIAVAVTGANGATPAVTETSDGMYDASYTPTSAGTDNIAITLGGAAISGSPFTSVVAPGAISASASDVTAAPTAVVADGIATATVTVALRDANGNAIGGLDPLAFIATVSGSAIASALTETATAGTYTFGITSTVAESVTVTVEADGVQLDAQPSVQFTAGGVSAANSSASATPATGVTANGTAVSTVTVALRDAGANIVSGLAGTAFDVAVSGAASAGAVSETSTAGTYSFAVTNTVAQTVTVTVTAGGVTLSQTPTIEFVAGAATQIAINAGDNQSGTIGTAVAVTPSVIVRDANANPVAGVTVTFAVTAGGGALGGTGAVITNTSGIATSPAWTLGTSAGTNTLTATSAGLTGSPVTFTATGTAGSAAQMSITTQPSSSAVTGEALAQQPVLQLRDGEGNPVATSGVVITAAIATGGGVLAGTTTAATDSSGVAAFTGLAISGLVGSRTLEFTATGVAPVTSTAIAITAGPATQMSVDAGDNQSATVATAVAVPPAVLVRDASGNPIAGASVTFAVASGDGSLASPDAVTTSTAGIATSPAWTLGPVAGTNTLTATSAGLTGSPITFTATGVPDDADRLVLTIPPSGSVASGVAFAQQPVVRLRDQHGNNVEQSDVMVNASLASGDETLSGTLVVATNTAGTATFTDLTITGTEGARTLQFSATGLTAATSGTVTVTAGAASRIAINDGNNQNAVAGTEVGTRPSVIVHDASNNPVADISVTFAVDSGGGFIPGNGVVNTDSSGIATSPAWTLGTTAGPNTLTATSGSLTGSPVTFRATGTAGSATRLSIVTQPSAVAVNGVALLPQPAVQLLDANDNDVPAAGVVVTVSIAPGDGELGDTVTATTDEFGLATFENLTITGTAGPYTLTFSSGILTGATSETITLSSGAADSIAPNGGDVQEATAGTAVAVPPSVRVTDSGGNPVAGVEVTFAVPDGSGSLDDPQPVTTSTDGIATSPAWTLGAVPGENTLTATVEGLAGSPVTFTATGTTQ